MKRTVETHEWPIGTTSIRVMRLAALGVAAALLAVSCATTRVSVASDGSQGYGLSDSPVISGDGRYVAFRSVASNLVPDDTNGADDAFVHDGDTGTTSLVSVASDGTQGNDDSYASAMSPDGRFVVFHSDASNLVVDDVNGSLDVFVRDTTAGTTTLVSVASDGSQANGDSYASAISADGRYVAFGSVASNLVTDDDNGVRDVFVHDTVTGGTELASVALDGSSANGASLLPAMSSDGRYVAFYSFGSDLVVDDTNLSSDVFVHDATTGITSLVSVASDGTQGTSSSCCPTMSADGRYVAFRSYASNLVPGDTNGVEDIFLHDTVTGATSRESLASDGTQANDFSRDPTISSDGRYIAFESEASNLVPDDTNGVTDIFMHDTATGTTSLVSITTFGTQGDYYSADPAISSDGRYVAFWTLSALVPDDTNGVTDVFRRGPLHWNIVSPTTQDTATTPASQ